MSIDEEAFFQALQKVQWSFTTLEWPRSFLEAYEAAKANSVMGEPPVPILPGAEAKAEGALTPSPATQQNDLKADSPEVEARVAPGADGSIPSSANQQPDESLRDLALLTPIPGNTAVPLVWCKVTPNGYMVLNRYPTEYMTGEILEIVKRQPEREYSNRQGLLDNWLPIETAPLDGSKFLSYFGGYCCTAWYDDCRYNQRPRPYFACSMTAMGVQWMLKNQPAHWMPLPQPPEQPRRG